MNIIKKIVKSRAFLAFALGALLYMIVSLPELIRYNGLVLYTSDYTYMALPNFIHTRDAILSGNTNWDWISGTGSQFIGSYITQQLSPLYILNLIVPREALLYALTYISALKYGAGAMFAYFYIRGFVKNDHLAVVGGLLYMFSSFAAYTVVFNFTDILMMFPLLLYSLDELCVNGRRGLFAVSVALVGFNSVYFLFSEAVFCVIYYFIRCTDKEYGASVKQFLRLAAEAVAGFCMTMVISLPCLLYLLEMPRTTSTLRPDSMLLYHDIFHYLKIFQSAFMLPDPVNYTSMFPETEKIYPFGTNFACAAAFIPLFGAAGTISWLWARHRTWQSKLLLICAVMAFVPVLNSLFMALNSAYYARWFFMPMLIGIVVSVKALDEEISFKPGLIINGGILAALFIYLVFIKPYGLAFARNTTYNPTGIIDFNSLMSPYGSFAFIQLLIPAASITALYFIAGMKRNKSFNAAMYTAAAAAAILTFSAYTYYYSDIFAGSEELSYTAELYNELAASDSPYKDDRLFTQSANDFSNMFYINMLQNAQRDWNVSDIGNLRYIEASGYGSGTAYDQFDIFECSAPADLLSAKYIVTLGEPLSVYFEKYGVLFFDYDEEKGAARFEDVCHVGEPREVYNDVFFHENLNYVPMGFTYDKMISREAYDSLGDYFETYDDLRHKIRLPMKAVIVEDPALFSDILPLADGEINDIITDEEYLGLVEKRRAECCNHVDRNTDGLTAHITLSKENLVFFSASWNSHWSAYVDGEKTDYYNVNNGMIGVRVPAGTHEIKLVYRTPGLLVGGIVSGASLLAFIVYLFVTGRKKE